MFGRRVFNLLLVLLSVALAEEKAAAPEEKAAAPKAASCTAEAKKIASLEKELKELKEAQAATPSCPVCPTAAGGGLPYISTDIFSHAIDTVHHFSTVGLEKSKDLVPEWAPADLHNTVMSGASLSADALTVASEQVSAAFATALPMVQEVANSTCDTALNLYKSNLEPHIGEHINAAMEVYTAQVEPHVGTARTMFAESVYPHVETGVTALAAGALMAVEASSSVTPVIKKSASQAFETVTAISDAPLKQIQAHTEFLTTPFQFDLLGKHFRFPRGWIDVVLAAFQAFCVLYVLIFVIGRFFFFLGFKIFYKLIGKTAYSSIRLSFKAFFKTIGLNWKVFKFAFGWTFTLFFCFVRLVMSVAMGCGTAFGVEIGLREGAEIKLDWQMRVGLYAGVSFLFFLIGSCCCGRRKGAKAAKADKEATKETKKKAETKDAKAAGDAKGAAKAKK
eukprot:gnl/TRDRNA2_/TRDRNA2_193299_c0_seq1.p1 gnl/TRDRNA2_/TRDRNA2_193299_c0~~gnl/TRDRNA2_/TRDRNA2_193299_c0_seq1.p1  ORF type:complete len:473 (+),score=131.73 gnl/TRDRNA2_/TRDRNA2_193299_c0_seq1:72-1421(+)